MRLTWRTVGIGLLSCTLIGLIFAAQFVLSSNALGRPITWAQALKWNLPAWYLWALLGPAIHWMSRRSTFSQGRWAAVLFGHLGFGALVASIHVVAFATWTWLAAPLSPGPPDLRREVRELFARGFSWDLFCYAAIAASFYAIDYAQRYREGQTRAARLQAQLASAKLDALRMQLHPHFLFNTLNAITALIRDDPRGAEEMVTRLSDLLRLCLEKSEIQQVSLREELDFVQKYLDIQRVRFGDRLEVRVEPAEEALDIPVPTLILQPVVENAVRYGLSGDANRCQVRVRARVLDRVLRLEVQDSGPGLTGDGAAACAGIGIANTKARLRQTYGDRARLTLDNAAPHGCIVSLDIPIAEPPASEDFAP